VHLERGEGVRTKFESSNSLKTELAGGGNQRKNPGAGLEKTWDAKLGGGSGCWRK